MLHETKSNLCPTLKETLEIEDYLGSTCSIDAIVPTSVHYTGQSSSASAVCQDAAPLADSMSDTLVLQPLLAMETQNLRCPTPMVPLSMKVVIPIHHLLTPDAAPCAALCTNSGCGTAATSHKRGRVITRLEPDAKKSSNYNSLCLIQALGCVHLARPP